MTRPSADSGPSPDTVRCPGCEQQVARSSASCPHCGYPINPPTRGLSANHALATARPLPPQIALEGRNLFADHHCILIGVAPDGGAALLDVDQPITLGRATLAAPDSGFDLSGFDAMRYGVSRQHAMLARQAGQLFVTDLSSANGTYINHDRLDPGETRPVEHGDLLTLGLLQLTISFGGDQP